MRFAAAVGMVFLFVMQAFSQTGPCTETTVKSLIDKPAQTNVADDSFYFTGAVNPTQF